jgi:autotransporter-associated beta strand protein
MELEGHFPGGDVTLNAGQVVLRPQEDVTIENTLSGSATNISVIGSASRQTFDLGSDFLTSSVVKVADDAQLRSVRVESALMSGGWINQRDSSDEACYGLFRREGPDSVDYYIQFLDFGNGCPAEGYTKIVLVRFTCENGALYVQACGCCSRPGNWLGHDSSAYGLTSALATSATANGYGIHNLVVTAVTGERTIQLSGSNENSLAAGLGVEVDGAGLVLTARKRLPETFALTLTNASVSTFSMSGMEATQGDKSKYSIDIVGDSVLALGSEWNVGEYAQLVIDGGLLAITYRSPVDKDGHEYLERVTLRNKAQITGYAFRVGYHTAIASFLRSEGEGPNVVASGVVGVLTSGKTGEHVFDTAADLMVLGPLTDLSDNYKGLGWTKRGSATLTLAGANGTASGTVRIEAGTLSLGDGNIFTKTNLVTFAGGTLAVGVMTNNLGAVTLEADSVIQLGTGCVKFADSSANSWTQGAKLSIFGSDKKLLSGRLRFSTGEVGLSSAQLTAIRYNGEGKVQLDSEGWLISRGDGFVVLVR